MKNRRQEVEVVEIKAGNHKGQQFMVEGLVTEMGGWDGATDLVTLAMKGNWAARNALAIDGYTAADGPFYYGKIDGYGYIISKKDLYGE